MRKTIVTLVALCAAMTANATILRVSNVNGSTAPYSTIKAAHDAASEGDTIMVDGSETRYGLTEISKRVVLIGPGFWINDNGLVQEAAPAAIAEFLIHAGAAGTVIEGFKFEYKTTTLLTINADNCIVRRCYFWNHSNYVAIRFSRDDVSSQSLPNPSGAVIQQNFFADCGISIYGLKYETEMTNVLISNNIFVNNGGGYEDISHLSNSQIEFNTMIGGEGNSGFNPCFGFIYSSSIEHNIIRRIKTDNKYEHFRPEIIRFANANDIDTNEWSDNIEKSPSSVKYKTDKDILELEAIKEYSENYGAFAGDSPYVISGIPSAPVIEDLVVPTTVEAGSKMKVTIKVGIQK